MRPGQLRPDFFIDLHCHCHNEHYTLRVTTKGARHTALEPIVHEYEHSERFITAIAGPLCLACNHRIATHTKQC